MHFIASFFVISFAAKDEDRTSCGSSTEALPALPSGLYHRNHFQLLAQGKVRQIFVCHTERRICTYCLTINSFTEAAACQ